MAKDHGLYAVKIPRNIITVMRHDKLHAGNLKPKNAGQIRQAGLPQVIVAPDRIDGSVQAQFIQIAFPDNVPRMQNMRTVLQLGHHFPPKQTVRIGDDGDADRLTAVSCLIHRSVLPPSGNRNRMIPDYTGKRTACKGSPRPETTEEKLFTQFVV